MITVFLKVLLLIFISSIVGFILTMITKKLGYIKDYDNKFVWVLSIETFIVFMMLFFNLFTYL